MKVLMTTSRSILALDVCSGFITPIHRGFGLYYGIARHNGDIIVAARRRGVDERGGPQDDRGCLIAFESPDYRPIVIEPDVPLRDLHGIASVEGALWCTCTFDNAIAVMKSGEFSFYFPLGKPHLEPRDRNHINTIMPTAEGVLILGHNWGPSEVYLLDTATFTVLRRWQVGAQAHNIWFDGDAMRVCSSADGRLVGLDGFELNIGEFPRGYASDGRVRLVGLNTNTTREFRDSTDSYIAVLNMNYDEAKRFRLNDEGMINDIMELTKMEYIGLLNQIASGSSPVKRRERAYKST